MLIDPTNPFIELLKLLGCDLTYQVTTWKEVAVLAMAFVFGCFMLYLLCKFLYGMMTRFFRGRF